MQWSGSSSWLPLLLAAVLLSAPAVAAIEIDWITIGDAGNEADSTGFGAVGYTYATSKHEVTNVQYAEFLNAVGKRDPNSLYSPSMTSPSHGGITRSGVDGSFVYSVNPGFVDRPVNYVSFYDALRFANWLNNGQPTGPQDTSTTEDGAYTITAAGISSNSIARNAEALIVLTSEDEWYKAAYYEPLSQTYFDYPAGSDALTVCAAPSGAPNTANCNPAVGSTSEIGAYTGSPSPFGTFDQGGNVWEWQEATGVNSDRFTRGGGWAGLAIGLAASFRDPVDPAIEDNSIGFRIAMIPEPSTGLLLGMGLLGMIGYGRRLVVLDIVNEN